MKKTHMRSRTARCKGNRLSSDAGTSYPALTGTAPTYKVPGNFTVIETPVFTRLWPDYWTEDERGEFVAWLEGDTGDDPWLKQN